MTATLQSDLEAASTPDTAVQLTALLTGAGIAPLTETGWIRVTGSDRVRWLNGMVTNSIQQLTPGQGCYNFALNAQGRIQADLTAFAQPDSLLLETDRERLPALIALLDRFIIMDDVELADISETRHGIVIAGPNTASLFEAVGLAIGPPSPLHLESAPWHGAPLEILYAHRPLTPQIELWADASTIAALTAELLAHGTVPVEPEALEHLRILSGTPRYGTDIRNTETARDLPQETGQTRALHFSKGCYLGQEIVERIHSRGNVHRAFSGFELTGTLPAPGTALQVEGKAAGELTSVAAIQLPNSAAPIQLALGYVRREALERGQPLEFPGGQAKPITLPNATVLLKGTPSAVP